MDIFATKGIEYVLVIFYLLTLVPCWWLLRRITLRPAPVLGVSRRPALGGRHWFDVPEGLYFHRGHTWASPDDGGLLRVGIDDFARRLLGPPEAVLLPWPGEALEQGEKGWQLQVGGHWIDLLSPVRGNVVEINEAVLHDPALVSDEPYGRGWLFKVRAAKPGAVLGNLLPSHLARAWTEEAAERLDSMMGENLGVVLQDGGPPLSGFVRELAGERWPEIAAELLLTARKVGTAPSGGF